MPKTVRIYGLAASMVLGLGAVSASAATVTFDFGLLGGGSSAPSGASPCAHNCVIDNKGEDFFTTGGVSVGAIGYNASDAIKYVTQKPGTFSGSGGETGLGESNTHPTPSDPDYEITRSTWLLIDNALAFADGYRSGTFSIESLQRGEGAKVYAYTGGLGSLDESKLSLLGTLSNPGTGGVTQTIDVPIDSKYLVVQAYEPPHGASGADIVVAQEVLNTAAAPEASTWAMMMLGFAGLGFAGYRKTKKAAFAA